MTHTVEDYKVNLFRGNSSYPRQSAFICGLFFFVLATAATASAQNGGKAEPNRIEFKRGAMSTTISGTVRGSEEAEYVLAAKKGQKLTIRITSVPARSAGFDLHGPDDVDLGLESDTNLNISVVLPKTGDYMITVVKLTDLVRTSRYQLTVSVR